VAEVDRGDAERARRRQDDEVRVVAMALDVLDQPAVRQQADRVERHAERAAGRLLQRARIAGGEDVDALGAELERVGDRRVVGDPAVHEDAVGPWHRRQHAGKGGAAEDRLDDRPAREAQLLAGDDVDGDDVERDRHVLELAALDVALEQPPQARLGDEMIARADEAEQARERVERERLSAAQPAPDVAERVGGRRGLRTGGDERAVQCPGGRAHDEVRDDLALVERAQHPDLDRAERRAAREDEGDGRRAGALHHFSWRRSGARCYGSGTGRTHTQDFVSGPTRSLRAGPNSASTSRRPSSAMSSQAPVAPRRQ
jgi:hypothetical protein